MAPLPTWGLAPFRLMRQRSSPPWCTLSCRHPYPAMEPNADRHADHDSTTVSVSDDPRPGVREPAVRGGCPRFAAPRRPLATDGRKARRAARTHQNLPAGGTVLRTHRAELTER